MKGRGVPRFAFLVRTLPFNLSPSQSNKADTDSTSRPHIPKIPSTKGCNAEALLLPELLSLLSKTQVLPFLWYRARDLEMAGNGFIKEAPTAQWIDACWAIRI